MMHKTEIKRKEIIDAAFELMLSKGYASSISIILCVSISLSLIFKSYKLKIVNKTFVLPSVKKIIAKIC